MQEGKNYQQKKDKSKEMSCFEELDLFWRLKISPVAWTSFLEV
jgi:hypothetical protein